MDGKALAREVQEQLKTDVEAFKAERGYAPGLAVVLVGEDPASQVYVRNKERMAKRIGMYSEVYRLDAATSMEELLKLIDKLNRDPAIHGILVQSPPPPHIDENTVIRAIDPKKDVDGMHPYNSGLLLMAEKAPVSCTPKGIMRMLTNAGIDPAGKSAVVIGRSILVGKPIANLLLNANATVTICHSRTRNLSEITKTADILVVAVGRARFITGDMIRQGATVIDVGINRIDDHLIGDVDFESAEKAAGYITPVPGGVGPMTIVMLMENTLEAAKG